MAGVHVGAQAGELTIIGTTLLGDSHATHGMIGIGISATAAVGASTSGGVGAATTTLGVLHTTITTIGAAVTTGVDLFWAQVTSLVAVIGMAHCVAHVSITDLKVAAHTVRTCVSLRL